MMILMYTIVVVCVEDVNVVVSTQRKQLKVF